MPDMKEEFVQIYRENIVREGADALLDYLENKSDFFTAPASARFHGSYAGGLCEHSVNVFRCLESYLARERVRELYQVEYPMESAAIAALLMYIEFPLPFAPGFTSWISARSRCSSAPSPWARWPGWCASSSRSF